MIKLQEYLEKIDHQVLNPELPLDKVELSTGYVSDLLSDVMGSAKDNMAWFTIMRHMNVIAVASMADIPCIIFGKNTPPEQAVIDKATEEGIVLIKTSLPVFDAAGVLYKLLHQD
jgi:serine kinase of HPr protein (carbohydrate metabolism regulator)